MPEKYDFGDIVSLNAAMLIYTIGVQVVVTDGRYLQISKEEK